PVVLRATHDGRPPDATSTRKPRTDPDDRKAPVRLPTQRWPLNPELRTDSARLLPSERAQVATTPPRFYGKLRWVGSGYAARRPYCSYTRGEQVIRGVAERNLRLLCVWVRTKTLRNPKES
ncbi:MAG: hypothetical protein ACI9WU_002763, partial [Myxococcota bacterium]